MPSFAADFYSTGTAVRLRGNAPPKNAFKDTDPAFPVGDHAWPVLWRLLEVGGSLLSAQEWSPGKRLLGPHSAVCEGGGPLLPLTWATVTGPLPPLPMFVLIEVHLCPRQCLSSSFCPQQEAVRVGSVVTQLPIQVVVTTTMGPQVPQ